MSIASSLRRSARKGLTLIELVVVLVVLVALAGIILPNLPNIVGRAHTASSSTNISETNKWVTTYLALYLQYPDKLDDLTDGTNVLPYLPVPSTGGYLSAGTLTTNELNQLKNAGISTLAKTRATIPASGNATFDIYTYTNPGVVDTTPLTATSKAATVTQADVLKVLGAQSVPGDKYVVFGLGQASDLIGKGVFEAPVHFDDGADGNPARVYQRYGLIFRVNDTSGSDKAQYVGAVAFHGPEFVGVANELQEYYNLAK